MFCASAEPPRLAASDDAVALYSNRTVSEGDGTKLQHMLLSANAEHSKALN